MAILMTAEKFIETAKEVQRSKTVYMWGTYGQVLTNALIDYKANQYKNHNTPARVARHKKLVGQGYSAWDCVGLIKGILWGWTPGKNPPYGAKGVPDTGSDGMYKNYCTHQSTDFSKIIPGCVVWVTGHIGVYIGGGLVVEATSRSGGGYTDNVMITALGNIGTVPGYPTRSWTHHGRLPWIDYSQEVQPEPEPTDVIIHTVVKGDTPWALAVRYLASGLRYKEIMAWNGLADNANIFVGQKLKVYTYGKPPYEPPKAEPEVVKHTVVKGDTPWGLAVKYLGAGSRYKEIMEASGLAHNATIYAGQVLTIPSGCVQAEPEVFKAYKVRVNTKNGLNVRSTPSVSGRVIKTLGDGLTVEITGEEADGGRTWGRTEAHGGWIALDFTVRV